MIKKTILIGEKHQEWLEDNSINLSKFVRKAIEEKMYANNKSD